MVLTAGTKVGWRCVIDFVDIGCGSGKSANLGAKTSVKLPSRHAFIAPVSLQSGLSQ
jgi:hypothetical protein